MKSQKGMALLEVIVALALLGIIGVLFMQGAVNSAHARVQVDERASAKILAESVIESEKKMDYNSTYNVTVHEYPVYRQSAAEYMGSNDTEAYRCDYPSRQES